MRLEDEAKDLEQRMQQMNNKIIKLEQQKSDLEERLENQHRHNQYGKEESERIQELTQLLRVKDAKLSEMED